MVQSVLSETFTNYMFLTMFIFGIFYIFKGSAAWGFSLQTFANISSKLMILGELFYKKNIIFEKMSKNNFDRCYNM